MFEGVGGNRVSYPQAVCRQLGSIFCEQLSRKDARRFFLAPGGILEQDMEIVADPRNQVPSRILAWQ